MSHHNTDILPGLTAEDLSVKETAISSIARNDTAQMLEFLFSDSGRKLMAEAISNLAKELRESGERDEDVYLLDKMMDNIFDVWAERRMSIYRENVIGDSDSGEER